MKLQPDQPDRASASAAAMDIVLPGHSPSPPQPASDALVVDAGRAFSAASWRSRRAGF